MPIAHIEGTIYVISFILIACYLTFLVGILIEEVSLHITILDLLVESACSKRRRRSSSEQTDNRDSNSPGRFDYRRHCNSNLVR